ncbi:Protein PhoH [compost metagenome]
MAKTLKYRKNQRNNSRSSGQQDRVVNQFVDPRDFDKPRTNPVPKKLEARTAAQGQYLSAMMSADLIFGVGPAGTGKTYVAGAWAADQLADRLYDRIIITRPAVETGSPMGFLPGELEEKYAPFLEPFKQVMIERMGRGAYECALKNERISPQPLAYMRGATFKNAIVILDEAQNTTPEEMKMFLTRIGEDCIVIVNGDIQQIDIKGASGLVDALNRVSHLDQVRVVEFTEDDIVRSGLVKAILKAYRNP